jgi:hypothetical protein
MVKKGFTLEEHREIGAKLGLLHDELITLHVQIGNAYKLDLSNGFISATKKIDKIRSDLENVLLKEHPELDNKDFLNIYYGTLSGKRNK